MKLTRRRIAVGAAGLALLAAAGGAYAATQSRDAERQAFLNDAAKRLNVTPQQLTDALKQAAIDRIDAAVKAGRLTQAQGDALEQRIQQGDFPFPGGGPGFRHGPGRGLIFGAFDAAAKYLGLTDEQLHQQLESGKSLADVAKAKGKGVDGLKSAIKAQLDADVKAGRLTQAQEDRIVSRLDDIVNRTHSDHPRGRRFFGPPGPPPGAYWR